MTNLQCYILKNQKHTAVYDVYIPYVSGEEKITFLLTTVPLFHETKKKTKTKTKTKKNTKKKKKQKKKKKKMGFYFLYDQYYAFL